MTDLISWLKARLDEDEQVARTAFNEERTGHVWERRNLGPGVWRADHALVDGDDMSIYDEGGHSEEQAQHIARHDPARVLREVEAKRRVIVHYEASRDYARTEYDRGQRDGLWFALLHLATAYSDHPDFDPAWKPA